MNSDTMGSLDIVIALSTGAQLTLNLLAAYHSRSLKPWTTPWLTALGIWSSLTGMCWLPLTILSFA